MALEQFANIADIVSALLVILTLIFLTLQVRQNTKALRSTAIQAVLQSELELGRVFADNATTWEKVVSGAPLDNGEERRKGIILYNMFMIDSGSRFHQHGTGFLDEKSWQARLQILPDIVNLPIYATWRASLGARTHSADFLELVDALANGSSGERYA